MKMADQFKVIEFSKKWLSTHQGNWPIGWGFKRLVSLIEQELSITVREATLRVWFKSLGMPYPTEHMNRSVASKNKTRSQLLRLQKALVELYERLGESVPVYLTNGFKDE